jgi:hypothetical protein
MNQERKKSDWLDNLARVPVIGELVRPLVARREVRRAEEKARQDKFKKDGEALRKFGQGR